jgi:hypothetical protein
MFHFFECIDFGFIIEDVVKIKQSTSDIIEDSIKSYHPNKGYFVIVFKLNTGPGYESYSVYYNTNIKKFFESKKIQINDMNDVKSYFIKELNKLKTNSNNKHLHLC